MLFFQPDKRKIGITLLLILILLIGAFFTTEFDSDRSDDYTRDPGLLIILLLPVTLISGAYNTLACGDFMDCGMGLQGMPFMMGLLSLILELIYLYSIACTIVVLIDKFKKKKSG